MHRFNNDQLHKKFILKQNMKIYKKIINKDINNAEKNNKRDDKRDDKRDNKRENIIFFLTKKYNEKKEIERKQLIKKNKEIDLINRIIEKKKEKELINKEINLMDKEEEYTKLINIYDNFNIDPIQFFININTINLQSANKVNYNNLLSERCLICHENYDPNENWIKNKCCNGYYHNKCFYDNIEYKNKNVELKFKRHEFFKRIYKFITNNVNDSCILCRKQLNRCYESRIDFHLLGTLGTATPSLTTLPIINTFRRIIPSNIGIGPIESNNLPFPNLYNI